MQIDLAEQPTYTWKNNAPFFFLPLNCQTIFPIKTFTYVCGTFTEELDLHQNVMFMLQLK